MPAFRSVSFRSQRCIDHRQFECKKFDDETLSCVQTRTAKHGVSMEEEACWILKEAVSASDHLGDLALRIFGPEHGVDLRLPERTLHDPLDLTG